MSISLMKIIDEYAGRIIMYFISVFKKINGNKIINTEISNKNILFIKFWGIGSIILTTAAVRKVKATYPDAKIFFLTLNTNMEICKEIKCADEIISINISNPFNFITDFYKKTFDLRKNNFDIIYDFEFYTYFSAIIVYLMKCKKSFGFDNLKNNRKIVFTQTIPFEDNIHTKDNFIHLVNTDESVLSGNYVNDELPSLSAITSNANGGMKITINVNASKLAYERRLPGEYYVKMTDFIAEHFSCKVILTGSDDETEYVNNIYRQVKEKNHVDNLCGKTSVKELISVIKSSACLITNDSGPLHIASALNIPVIAFFGPESPQRYGPLSCKSLVFYKHLECSPCMSVSNSKTVNCIYDSPKCMEQFDITDMIRKVNKFIRELKVPEKIKETKIQNLKRNQL
ncbi:MAG: glycosyltransferase family 9 protein [Ignavibacteria bacterium]|nr:glycosyltransferase family 9 protein [Ignavibacteria bacterium]